MSKIAGIQIKKNARGKASHLIINVQRHPELVEDILDIIEAEKHRNEPTIPWEEVKKELDKKFGIKK